MFNVGDVVETSRQGHRKLDSDVPEGIRGTVTKRNNTTLQIDWHEDNTIVEVRCNGNSYSTPKEFKDSEGWWRNGSNWDEESFVLAVLVPHIDDYKID